MMPVDRCGVGRSAANKMTTGQCPDLTWQELHLHLVDDMHAALSLYEDPTQTVVVFFSRHPLQQLSAL